jgi:hypothetical protein
MKPNLLTWRGGRLTMTFLAVVAVLIAAAVLAPAHFLIGLVTLKSLALLLKGPLAFGITNTPTNASQGPNTTAPDPTAGGFNTSNCDPKMIMVDDAMSLTRANITGWNKQDIESQMFKEVGLDRIIAQTKEARMAGSKQRTLTDLLLSRHTPLKMGGGVNTQSVIQPFRLVPRRNRVNPGYFRVATGVSLANFTAQGGSAGSNVSFTGLFNGTITLNSAVAACWVLTVNNGSIDLDSSPFAKSPNNVLRNPEKYFLPRHSMTAEFVNAGGSHVVSQFRIVDSAPGPDANQAYILVIPNQTFKGDSTIPAGTLTPNGTTPAQVTGVFGNLSTSTNGWWDTASAGAQANYQPTTGIVRIGANAVSDFQQYGNALPGYNEYGLLEYWRQTNRWVHKYNDEYVKALEATTTSEGLKKFRLLPLAKLRAQQEKFNEDFMFESCFYGDVENGNQTISNWNNLPQVQDPAWAQSGESGTLAIEYLSRTIGVRTQIYACGNVYDAQQGPLDLDALFEAGYYVKREREGESNQTVDQIDIMTDQRFTRPMLRQLMTRYYKQKYGLDNVTMFMKAGEKITFNGSVMFEYDSYELPDHGYVLNVFSDLYFDDRIAQFQGGQKSAGRAIWMIDWSDINVGVIKNMSVPRTNNLADNVYKYVIQQNVQHVLLNSRTFEVSVGNTNRHRMFENYSDACAKITVPGCDLSANK